MHRKSKDRSPDPLLEKLERARTDGYLTARPSDWTARSFWLGECSRERTLYLAILTRGNYAWIEIDTEPAQAEIRPGTERRMSEYLGQAGATNKWELTYGRMYVFLHWIPMPQAISIGIELRRIIAESLVPLPERKIA